MLTVSSGGIMPLVYVIMVSSYAQKLTLSVTLFGRLTRPAVAGVH